MKQDIMKGMPIEIKDGEIVLVPGAFYAMGKNGEIVESWDDSNDILKLYGGR